MSFKDVDDREKHSPLWPFLVTLLVALAVLAAFVYLAMASTAYAQTPGQVCHKEVNHTLC